MRRTEMTIGILAGIAGIALGLLFLFNVFPQSSLVPDAHNVTYAYICIAANCLGLAGGILVRWKHFVGSGFMAAAMIIIMFFGFPWQVIPSVAYIVSVIMALVPEKLHEK